MAIKIAAGVSGALQEVDPDTLAARVSLRPVDVGALGSYQLSSVGGTYAAPMAAALSAASPIWSCRFAPTVVPTSVMLVKKILFHMASGTTAFTAGGVIFNLFPIRSYTIADTGGAALTINTAATTGKLRTSYPVTGLVDFRTSATATLTAGTQTVDTNPIATINTTIPATANLTLIPYGTVLFEQKPGEQPLVLATGEGLVLRATVPATGVWVFGVTMVWDEVASF